MEQYEMVEKLVLKTGVTYEEAKEALTACDWDLLDAIVYLEKLGKVKNGTARYSTGEARAEETPETYRREKESSFGEACGRFFSFLGRLIDKGNQNYLDVSHRGAHVLSISMTVLVILLLIGFWCIVPLMIVGLFFHFEYHFRGTGKEEEINDILNRASNAAESVKNEMKGQK